MRTSALLTTSLALITLDARADDAREQPIPHDCPVTIPIEPRYNPPPLHKAPEPGSVFLHGSDALYTQLYSDGRWRGIKSPTGTRNKSAWFRKDAEWGNERPYQLVVTARRRCRSADAYSPASHKHPRRRERGSRNAAHA
jgi:hypothetical protein